jgi:hypothetical protein
MNNASNNKLYQLTAIASLLFALLGFSYNAWRLEVSETNNTIRTASFQMLLELGALEQLVFALHYDNSSAYGNLRTGWVKVGLIRDLSSLSTASVQTSSQQLYEAWQQHSDSLQDSNQSATSIINAADQTRAHIKLSLAKLP